MDLVRWASNVLDAVDAKAEESVRVKAAELHTQAQSRTPRPDDRAASPIPSGEVPQRPASPAISSAPSSVSDANVTVSDSPAAASLLHASPSSEPTLPSPPSASTSTTAAVDGAASTSSVHAVTSATTSVPSTIPTVTSSSHLPPDSVISAEHGGASSSPSQSTSSSSSRSTTASVPPRPPSRQSTGRNSSSNGNVHLQQEKGTSSTIHRSRSSSRSTSPAPLPPTAAPVSVSSMPVPRSSSAAPDVSLPQPPSSSIPVSSSSSTSAASSILPRSTSGNLLNSFLQRVTHATSGIEKRRKASQDGADDDKQTGTTAPIPVAAAAITPASASSSSSSLASLLSENRSLHSQLDSLREETASLRCVWEESRSKNERLKELLQQQKEDKLNRLREMEMRMQQELEQREQDHARTLSRMRDELTRNESEIFRLKTEHSRQVRALEDQLSELNSNVIPQLHGRLTSMQHEMDEQVQHHETERTTLLAQLSKLQSEFTTRDPNLDERRQRQEESLRTEASRNESLEREHEQLVQLVAKLQRSVEEKEEMREKAVMELRALSVRRAEEDELIQVLQSRLEQQSRTHAAEIHAAKARHATIQARLDEQAMLVQEAKGEAKRLQQRVQELESAQRSISASPESALSSASPSSPSSSNPSISDLEARVQSLTDSLLAKSSSLDRVMSERAALRLQFETEHERATKLEKQLTSVREQLHQTQNVMHQGRRPSMDGDEESGFGSSSSSSAMMRVRNKGLPFASNGINNDRNGSGGRAVMQRAMSFVDRLGQHLAILLRRYPQVRLGFILYIVILHLWFALVFSHLMNEYGAETHAIPIPSPTPHATYAPSSLLTQTQLDTSNLPTMNGIAGGGTQTPG